MKTIASGLESPQLKVPVQPAVPSSVTSTERRSASDVAPSGRRRGWLFGAGAAGVASVAALTMHKLAPSAVQGDLLANRAASPAGNSNDAGGYQETQHVMRYYETTRS